MGESATLQQPERTVRTFLIHPNLRVQMKPSHRWSYRTDKTFLQKPLACSTREDAQVLLPPAVDGVSVVANRHSPQNFILSQCRIQQMFVPHFLPNCIPIYDLLLAGLIVICASLLLRFILRSTRLWPCYSHSGGERRLPCSCPSTCSTHSPIPLPRRPFVGGLADSVPALVLQPWFPSICPPHLWYR